jgi:hypothetical protein
MVVARSRRGRVDNCCQPHGRGVASTASSFLLARRVPCCAHCRCFGSFVKQVLEPCRAARRVERGAAADDRADRGRPCMSAAAPLLSQPEMTTIAARGARSGRFRCNLPSAHAKRDRNPRWLNTDGRPEDTLTGYPDGYLTAIVAGGVCAHGLPIVTQAALGRRFFLLALCRTVNMSANLSAQS